MKIFFHVFFDIHSSFLTVISQTFTIFLSFSELDPCRNVNCTYESFCYAYTPWRFDCICKDNCPSYEEQVCASNGRTFKNMCFLKKEICKTRGNYTNYHPGSCRGKKEEKKNSSRNTGFSEVYRFILSCFTSR